MTTDNNRGTGRTTRMMELATAMAEREEVKIFAIFATAAQAHLEQLKWPKVTCLSMRSTQVERDSSFALEPRYVILGVPHERVFIDHYAAETIGYGMV